MALEGSLALALGSALGMAVGLFAERQALVARWAPYFIGGLPLGAEPLPLVVLPEGAGRTASVAWERVPGAGPVVQIRFWAPVGGKTAPSGLHGVVWLTPQTPTGPWRCEVRWAPPFTPALGAFYLAVLGVVRGEPQVTIPIACFMLVGLFLVYFAAARRAAAELRWAFVKDQ